MSTIDAGKETEDHRETAPHPTLKRRRIALACNSCRRRRTKCDGAKPKCKPCSELGFSCSYPQSTASENNGEAADYGIRLDAIEATLRRLADHFDGPDEASQPGKNVSFVATETLTPASGDLVEIDRVEDAPGSASAETMDGMATIGSLEEDSQFFGPSSNISFLRDISNATKARLSIVPRIGAASQSNVSRGPRQEIEFASNVDSRILPPQPLAMRLISLYFSDTGLLFPFLSETHIVQEYTKAKARNFAGISRSFLCLLNIIFAFATYVTVLPEQSVDRSAAEADIYFQRAFLLSSGFQPEQTSVRTVQCLLLISQYRQGGLRSTDAWDLLSLAVRAAMRIGMHCPPLAAMDEVETEMRKRTWMGCIFLDRTLSMTYGRPPMIPNSYILFDLSAGGALDKSFTTMDGSLLRGDFSTSSSCLFVTSIELYYILGDIVAKLHGSNLERNHRIPLPDMLKHIVDIEQRLGSWKAALPGLLKLEPWNSAHNVSAPADLVPARLSVISKLRYLNTRLLLHRPVLSRFLELGNNDDEKLTGGADSYFMDSARQSTAICTTCSIEIINVIHNMSYKPALLPAWWFSLYYTFNAALVLFGCSLIMARDDTDSQAAQIQGLQWLSPLDSVQIDATIENAIEAIERLGRGSRHMPQICENLRELVKIYKSLRNPRASAMTLQDNLFASQDWEQNVVITGPDGLHDLDIGNLFSDSIWSPYNNLAGL